ncbi:MAG: septal ring lytic transglycosylase RlpA family protein [Synechococcaceae cyanobacterium SM1_2_3]|nr:septal ring lytic transglycosylase RlpA family protein [Synechococcaceae cyanobacterium SM1_2_3]
MAKSSWSHALAWVSLAGALAGCSTIPDHPQSANPPPITFSDTSANSDEPIPKVEPPSRSGNPDTYVVFGRRYRVQETSEGYREEGTASWYGWEFHGRKTSSGPLFNMFELTAAHKSLPLPTYVQVTNLENGRQIVVKVTDRGPFIGERAIDLSYAAADRLGMLEQGTARVEIVALAPFQFLPKLAARRAEQRELLASRQNRPEPVIKPAAIQFARATPARPSAQAPGKPPAQVLARIEREKARKAQARASLLLAQAPVDRNAPKTTTRKVAGPNQGLTRLLSRVRRVRQHCGWLRRRRPRKARRLQQIGSRR